MNSPQPKIPGRTWATLFLTLCWLGAVLGVRHLRPVGPPPAAAIVAALRAELTSLPTDAERRLAEWRQAHPPESESDPTAVMGSALGPPWKQVTGPDGVIFRPAEPAALRWADIVGAIERLEKLPGLKVQGVQIETTGSRTLRQFGVVELTVQVLPGPRPVNPVRRAEEPRAGPGSGRGSAGLRETGSDPFAAGRPPPPPSNPAAGSVSRPCAASGPATLAPASDRFIPEPNH